MNKSWIMAALLAPLAVTALPSGADAEDRLGGYSPGAGPYGGTPGNRPPITRSMPVTPAAPAIRNAPAARPGPAVPPYDPVTSPRRGMSGYYQNNIGTVPPGTRATTVRPRYTDGR